jgi:bacillithiol system protein YtxJ
MAQLIPLKEENELRELIAADGCQIIFKHNTTCSISLGVKDRLEHEESFSNYELAIHLLDVRASRELSNMISGRFGVPHQSPQVLVIKGGRCIYHHWGYDISADTLQEVIQNVSESVEKR